MKNFDDYYLNLIGAYSENPDAKLMMNLAWNAAKKETVKEILALLGNVDVPAIASAVRQIKLEME